MPDFRAELLRRCEEAIASCDGADSTPEQRERADELRRWTRALVEKLGDAKSEKLAEHAFIVGAALERLIASNHEPWIEGYVRSLEGAARGGGKKEPGLAERDAKIDKYIREKLKTREPYAVKSGAVTVFGPDSGVEFPLSEESLRKRVSKISRQLKGGM